MGGRFPLHLDTCMYVCYFNARYPFPHVRHLWPVAPAACRRAKGSSTRSLASASTSPARCRSCRRSRPSRCAARSPRRSSSRSAPWTSCRGARFSPTSTASPGGASATCGGRAFRSGRSGRSRSCPRAARDHPPRFVGLDGYGSALTVEDALADDVLIADRLDGAPLTGDHGAPVRLVSSKQYGYMNTKHLCRLVLHTASPPARATRQARARSCSRSSPRIPARGWSTKSATGTCRPGRCGSPTSGSSCRCWPP